MDSKIQYVTQGKLNKMCKYFRCKPVTITFEYNNSLGYHSVRAVTCKYDDFEIKNMTGTYGSHYCLTFKKRGKEVFYHEIEQEEFFVGLGKIEYINSGPRCYFSIELKRSILKNIINRVINCMF
jgi:hypothetical protein